MFAQRYSAKPQCHLEITQNLYSRQNDEEVEDLLLKVSVASHRPASGPMYVYNSSSLGVNVFRNSQGTIRTLLNLTYGAHVFFTGPILFSLWIDFLVSAPKPQMRHHGLALSQLRPACGLIVVRYRTIAHKRHIRDFYSLSIAIFVIPETLEGT